MKLGNLIALPFAMIGDAFTFGEAGLTRDIMRDERARREIEAAEAIAKIIAAKMGKQNDR